MKKGFTLIELLCVVIILGILLILAIPSITNILNNEKNNISSKMEEIIFQSGELYIQDNSSIYTKVDGNVYCIQFNNLIDEGYLSNPLNDPVTNKSIDTSKYIKVSVEDQNYKYSITNECEKIEK